MRYFSIDRLTHKVISKTDTLLLLKINSVFHIREALFKSGPWLVFSIGQSHMSCRAVVQFGIRNWFYFCSHVSYVLRLSIKGEAFIFRVGRPYTTDSFAR